MHFFATLALVALAPAIAIAQAPSASDQEAAKAHFMAGSAYYEQANYGDAVKEFNEAYRLSHRADLLYNIALAYERLEQWDSAIAALRRYLDEKSDAPDRNIIQTRIGNLEKRRDAQRPAAPPPMPAPTPVAAPPPRPRHVVSLAVGGVGLAALAAALGTGISAQLLHDDLDKRCPGRLCPESARSDVDRGQALAISTD